MRGWRGPTDRQRVALRGWKKPIDSDYWHNSGRSWGLALQETRLVELGAAIWSVPSNSDAERRAARDAAMSTVATWLDLNIFCFLLVWAFLSGQSPISRCVVLRHSLLFSRCGTSGDAESSAGGLCGNYCCHVHRLGNTCKIVMAMTSLHLLSNITGTFASSHTRHSFMFVHCSRIGKMHWQLLLMNAIVSWPTTSHWPHVHWHVAIMKWVYHWVKVLLWKSHELSTTFSRMHRNTDACIVLLSCFH